MTVKATNTLIEIKMSLILEYLKEQKLSSSLAAERMGI